MSSVNEKPIFGTKCSQVIVGYEDLDNVITEQEAQDPGGPSALEKVLEEHYADQKPGEGAPQWELELYNQVTGGSGPGSTLQPRPNVGGGFSETPLPASGLLMLSAVVIYLVVKQLRSTT